MSSLFAFTKTPSSSPSNVLFGRTFGGDEEGRDQIREEFRNLLWFTYRRNIPGAFDSDRGWGCTIRSTQMLFGNSLWRTALTSLAPDSTDGFPPLLSETVKHGIRNIKARVAHLFIDWPLQSAAFSIQKFVRASGYSAGRWYAPHESSHIVAKLAAYSGSDASKVVSGDTVAMQVLICPDACVAEDEVMQCGGPDNWKPTLVIIPLRLGVDSVDPELSRQLLNVMRLPTFAGAVGGSPRHSVFFVGVAGQNLLYLDPHTTQSLPPPPPLVEADEVTVEEEEARTLVPPCTIGGSRVVSIVLPPADDRVHETEGMSRFLDSLTMPESHITQAMHVTKIDPTITLGFLFVSKSQFDDWKDQMAGVCVKAADNPASPTPLTRLVEVVPSRPDFSARDTAVDEDVIVEGHEMENGGDESTQDETQSPQRQLSISKPPNDDTSTSCATPVSVVNRSPRTSFALVEETPFAVVSPSAIVPTANQGVYQSPPLAPLGKQGNPTSPFAASGVSEVSRAQGPSSSSRRTSSHSDSSSTARSSRFKDMAHMPSVAEAACARASKRRSGSFAEVIWNGKGTASPLFQTAQVDPTTGLPPDLTLEEDETAPSPPQGSEAASPEKSCSFREGNSNNTLHSVVANAWGGLTSMMERCGRLVSSPTRIHGNANRAPPPPSPEPHTVITSMQREPLHSIQDLQRGTSTDKIRLDWHLISSLAATSET